MTDDALTRVETACAELADAGETVTFTAVAAHARIGRATLYRRPDLRAVVEEHRVRARQAHTLAGLAAEIHQLRAALDAVADQVHRHDEALRRLNRDYPR